MRNDIESRGSRPRPMIAEYREPADFVRDMIRFRKTGEPGFSVQGASRSLRRVSPTLVSLIIKGKRSLTLDRVDEFAKLLGLSAAEKFYLRNWLVRLESRTDRAEVLGPDTSGALRRKEVSISLFSDWVNLYVKDLFQIPRVQRDPELLNELLAHVASPARITRSLKFLLREGYLRRTLDGRIVVETNLAIVEPRAQIQPPSKKVREVHKGALAIARGAIDVFPPSERIANLLTVPLDETSYAELTQLIEEFAEKLKDFAAERAGSGDRLYQILVNLSPIGGKPE